MDQVRKGVDRVLEWVLILLMALMVLNVIWQVLTRFVLQNPSSYTEELARYLLIWLGLLGSAYCVSRKSHLAIDIFTSSLSGTRKHLSNLLGHTMILLFAAVVLVTGGQRLVQTTLTYQQTSAALQIPLGYVYLALPLSGVLIIFYSLLSFLQETRCLLHRTAGDK
jgi:TRAP-type C4-dicarboxylate transport system permease small subunit